MTAYVTKDGQGRVVSVHAAPTRETVEVADNDAALAVFRAAAFPEPTYRDRRKAAYIAELGAKPDFVEAVGDVMDDLIREVAALRAGVSVTAEFEELTGKIASIKARFPKP